MKKAGKEDADMQKMHSYAAYTACAAWETGLILAFICYAAALVGYGVVKAVTSRFCRLVYI